MVGFRAGTGVPAHRNFATADENRAIANDQRRSKWHRERSRKELEWLGELDQRPGDKRGQEHEGRANETEVRNVLRRVSGDQSPEVWLSSQVTHVLVAPRLARSTTSRCAP
jgi:hypothetical protein